MPIISRYAFYISVYVCPVSIIALSVVSLVTEGSQPALIFHLLCQVPFTLLNAVLILEEHNYINNYESTQKLGKIANEILTYCKSNDLKIDDCKSLKSKKDEIIASAQTEC